MLSDGIKLSEVICCDFLPNTGENGVIYCELSTNHVYGYFDNLFHMLGTGECCSETFTNILKENSSEKTRCEYCGRLHSSEIEVCPSCGAIA